MAGHVLFNSLFPFLQVLDLSLRFPDLLLRIYCWWRIWSCCDYWIDDFQSACKEKGTGKRKCGQVEPKPLNGSYLRPQTGAVDRFGAISALSADKFGALGGLEDYSTASCTPDLEYNIHSGKHYQGTPLSNWFHLEHEFHRRFGQRRNKPQLL